MKKYNRIIIVSLLLYVMIATFVAIVLSNIDTKRNKENRIEINEFMSALSFDSEIEKMDIDPYQYIQAVSFIPANNIAKQDNISFFQEQNKNSISIQPWYVEDVLKGYIKFEYVVPAYHFYQILWIMEGTLLLLEVFILLVLWYIKRFVIVPFHRLSALPQQLASGHYKGNIVMEKGKYFREYLWSMGQLKDTLDISKKRQLDLVKEKKQMLLSLSHDVKTPLNLIKLYNKALQDNLYQEENSRKLAMMQIDNKASEIEEYIEKIITSAKEDILDLQVNHGEFYLQDLLIKVLAVYKEQCVLRNIDCIVHEFENRLLKGDIERSQEVLENLFENAFKYGDGKKIEISFYEEDYCQLIQFYSSGNPVQDYEYNHLFDSFFRGSNRKGQTGSGLGLYICHELMTKMGGTIFTKKCDTGMVFVLVFR